MKFDTKTLEILKNFSTINPSIRFDKGTVLKTVSPIKTILAKATVSADVEKTFCIGDLPRFMSTLSLFDSPEVSLGEKKATISDGKNKIEYVYTAEELIKTAPEADIKLPSVDVQFTLTNEMFQSVKKAMSVLSLPEMAVVGKAGKLQLQAFDATGTTKDNYSIDVGETDKTFTVVFKAENLKIMPLDYQVTISSKGISWFANPTIEYWIAIEVASSKFE